MLKWVVTAVALLSLGLGLAVGCGDDEDCINVSGTWYLTTDLSSGEYTDDQCTVEQRGCDITVACQGGTTSYGSVDGNRVSFPISWLSGGGDTPTVNRGSCTADKTGVVTLAGDAAGLGCGAYGAASLAPVHINVNCLEVGNATWERLAVTENACPFEDDFVASYTVEQSCCVLGLDTGGQAGIAALGFSTVSGSAVALDWPETEDITLPSGITNMLFSKGTIEDEEAADGVDKPPRVMKISVSYWTSPTSAEERCTIMYRVPSRL